MYQYEVAQIMAENRRKGFEREAEIHRWLREAEANASEANASPRRRAGLASRVLYRVGRLLVRLGRRLQQVPEAAFQR
jgi:hypothetical protein